MQIQQVLASIIVIMLLELYQWLSIWYSWTSTGTPPFAFYFKSYKINNQ